MIKGHSARTSQIEQTTLRHFGLIVGGIFGLLALWPAIIRGGDIRTWCLAVAAILILPATIAPAALAPAYRAWMTLGALLGWINTRLILGVLFLVLITPIAIVLRLAGRDAMRRAFDRDAATYRVRRTPRPGSHLLRQF
jgi:Saxitoxin biosynthesis operon protein SxtJ